VPEGLPRRALMGLAMALTAVALVYNRWGKRSGAHYNPALTLTFLRLGKVAPRDAAAYVAAQFAGGALGMLLAAALLAPWIGHPAVHYVATAPGPWGAGAAWAAEFAMTFLLMSVVLAVANTPRVARFTGLCAAGCVFLFITFAAPVSGMSLNPARTFASALAGGGREALWVYFTAPPLGMLAAAAARTAWLGRGSVACAKLHHQNRERCIFCEHQHGKSAAADVRKAAGAPPMGA
jgi:aquaporin Z